MKRRLAPALAALLLALSFAVPTSASVDTVICVIIYENGNNGGDSWSNCAGAPAVSNLSSYTTGLHNGCNTTFGTKPNWNDCMSSIRYTGLPPGYRIRTYYHTFYSGPFNTCFDVDGSPPGWSLNGYYNDSQSSYRLEAGSC